MQAAFNLVFLYLIWLSSVIVDGCGNQDYFAITNSGTSTTFYSSPFATVDLPQAIAKDILAEKLLEWAKVSAIGGCVLVSVMIFFFFRSIIWAVAFSKIRKFVYFGALAGGLMGLGIPVIVFGLSEPIPEIAFGLSEPKVWILIIIFSAFGVAGGAAIGGIGGSHLLDESDIPGANSPAPSSTTQKKLSVTEIFLVLGGVLFGCFGFGFYEAGNWGIAIVFITFSILCWVPLWKHLKEYFQQIISSFKRP